MEPLSYNLPLEVRLTHYRHSAEEAFRQAAAAGDDELRLSFLSMARAWETLAEDIERAMERFDGIEQAFKGKASSRQ